MARLDGTITVRNSQYRTCIVDGRNALFHSWEQWSEIVPPSPMVGGHGGGVVQGTFGIVEYGDGQIEKVLPYQIRFTDNIFAEYCFEGDTPHES